MMELHSSCPVDNNDLKQWIYPMFFSTKSGPKKIKIVNLIRTEPKTIRDIGNETNLSYYDVKYNVNMLKQNKFVVKINNKYDISEKFRKSYHVLDDIMHPLASRGIHKN